VSVESNFRASSRVSPDFSKVSRLHIGALGGLLALHFALRLWLAVERSGEGPAWDERFNINNIVSILRSGDWAPANFWYGGLSYLPQTLLLKALAWLPGISGRLSIVDGAFPRPAFAVCLALQAVYGTLSLLLAYRLGRRLLAPWTALAATAILAGTGRHLHASTFFKPDILLLLLSLATVLATLRVLERPTWRQFSLAGLAGGLATAAKLNGGLVLPPLALAAWLALRNLRQTTARLALAAAIAAGAYLLWNPHVRLHWKSLQRNLVHYENTVDDRSAPVLLQTLSFFAQSEFHGPLLALVALAGCALWLARAWRARHQAGWREPLVVLSFPVITFLVYAAMTDRAKANHFLQVLPFTSMWIAYFFVDGLVPWISRATIETATTRSWRRFAVPAVVGALVGWSTWQTVDFAYARAVAPTVQKVARLLEEAGAATPPGWWIAADPAIALGEQRIGWSPTWLSPIPSQAAGGAEDSGRLDRADAEVLHAAQLATAWGKERWDRVAETRRYRIAPKSLRIRGPHLVVLLHPHPLAQSLRLGPPRARTSNFYAWPESVPVGSLVSIRTKGLGPATVVRVAGHELAATALKSRRSWMLMTERFARPATADFEVVAGEAAKNARVDLFVWAAGAAGAAGEATPP
jgi:4-amino-4-deoxy-L-arabinose transferase-like glycosyltransferase